ncbi:hypothetical protein [Mycoplana ramosa]|uniref:Uncharacterized protein n=1 Tax=Mycoplana ramosa TaxID=40837 RepID=A0ABW3Z2J5_MYCRA
MFITEHTISTSRPLRSAELDSLGGECITIAELMREWQGHLYEDDPSTDC